MSNEDEIDKLLNHVTDNCDQIINKINPTEIGDIEYNQKKLENQIAHLQKVLEDVKNHNLDSPDIVNLNEGGIQDLLDEMVEDGLLEVIEINGKICYKQTDDQDEY